MSFWRIMWLSFYKHLSNQTNGIPHSRVNHMLPQQILLHIFWFNFQVMLLHWMWAGLEVGALFKVVGPSVISVTFITLDFSQSFLFGFWDSLGNLTPIDSSLCPIVFTCHGQARYHLLFVIILYNLAWQSRTFDHIKFARWVIRISVHIVCFRPFLYEPVIRPILPIVVNYHSKKIKYRRKYKENPE